MKPIHWEETPIKIISVESSSLQTHPPSLPGPVMGQIRRLRTLSQSPTKVSLSVWAQRVPETTRGAPGLLVPTLAARGRRQHTNTVLSAGDVIIRHRHLRPKQLPEKWSCTPKAPNKVSCFYLAGDVIFMPSVLNFVSWWYISKLQQLLSFELMLAMEKYKESSHPQKIIDKIASIIIFLHRRVTLLSRKKMIVNLCALWTHETKASH